MKKIPINYENQQSVDKASHIVYKFAGMYNKCSESVRFRQSDAVCRKCGRDLEVYYCENGLYAVRCVFCGMRAFERKFHEMPNFSRKCSV